MLKQGTAIERRDSALAERETLQKNIVREKEALSRALIVGEGAEERDVPPKLKAAFETSIL